LGVLGCTEHVAARAAALSSGVPEAMGFVNAQEKGIVTLFFWCVERKGTKKHVIPFLFQSTPKDLVRQILTPEQKTALASLAVAYRNKEFGVAPVAALKNALSGAGINRKDWLLIFAPDESNNDRYPG